jgi:hypothetical protein
LPRLVRGEDYRCTFLVSNHENREETKGMLLAH